MSAACEPQRMDAEARAWLPEGSPAGSWGSGADCYRPGQHEHAVRTPVSASSRAASGGGQG